MDELKKRGKFSELGSFFYIFPCSFVKSIFWTGKWADGRKEKLLSIFIEVEYFMQKREGHSLKKVVSLVLGKKGRRAILWIFQNIRFCFGYPFQQIPFRAVNCEKIENLHSCRHQFQLVNFLQGDDFCKKFIPYEEKSSHRLHTHKLLTYDWHQLGRKLKEAPQWPRFRPDM